MKFSCFLLLAWAALWNAANVSAQVQNASGTIPAFDCWIGNEGPPYYTYFIRCITDRDSLPAAAPDSPFDLVLDQLHRELHSGSSASVERTLKSNIALINESAGVWNIRIYSYPADWSWAEGAPERLVRAGLCPDRSLPCKIFLRRH